MFFDYFVSTQQHFESRLFWKNAEKLRKHAQLKSYGRTANLDFSFKVHFNKS